MDYKIGQRVEVLGVDYGTIVNIRGYYLTIKLDHIVPNSIGGDLWVATPGEVRRPSDRVN